MPLPQLPRLKSVMGDEDNQNKKIKEVRTPEKDRDAANKKWVEDNFTPL